MAHGWPTGGARSSRRGRGRVRGCRAPARVVVITPNTLRAALALLLVMGGERWEPRLDAVMARTGGLLTGVRTARRGR
jgi:hypothetical protein